MAKVTSEDQERFREAAPAYYGALMALGETHEERAAKLGVIPRQFTEYLSGRSFPSVHRLKALPELDAAYTQDFTNILPFVRSRSGSRKEPQAA